MNLSMKINHILNETLQILYKMLKMIHTYFGNILKTKIKILYRIILDKT